MAKFEQGYLIVQNGLHFEELAVSSTPARLLEIPVGEKTRRILIQTDGEKIRWLAFPGCVPAGDYGLKLDADDILVYDGEPADIRFILDDGAGGDTVLLVHYFGA